MLGGDDGHRPQPGRAPEGRAAGQPAAGSARSGPASRLAHRLAAAGAPAGRRLGCARPRVRPLGVRPRVAADARREPRDHPAARRRHAVVHDRLRPRHADHLVPDAPVRARARARCARGARRAPGDRRRRVDRRRAGQDRPRGPPREGGEGLVRALLRHRRRDAALPRAALGGVALDAGHVACRAAARARAARARVDRRLRRPRRRRLRRVPAPDGARAREPVVEGLGRLAALRRRPHRRAADRSLRGAGLRLRREAADWPSSPARRGATPSSPSGSRARPPRCSNASTRRSGSTSAAGTTRSPSTGRSGRSTRSAPTSGTCSGAGSSRISGRSRWPRR